jgi:hypothetical protein
MIIVGFAFLLNPLVVGAYDIGDPDRYQYEASDVEFFDNESSLSAPLREGDC